ncbi:hypothetical protein HK100_008727, partial [Physocladia obscura]
MQHVQQQEFEAALAILGLAGGGSGHGGVGVGVGVGGGWPAKKPDDKKTKTAACAACRRARKRCVGSPGGPCAACLLRGVACLRVAKPHSHRADP